MSRLALKEHQRIFFKQKENDPEWKEGDNYQQKDTVTSKTKTESWV